MSVAHVDRCADHGAAGLTACWVGECSRCGRPVHLSAAHPRPLDPCTRCTPTVRTSATATASSKPALFPSAARARRYFAQPVGRADVIRAAAWILSIGGYLAWRDLT